MESAAFGGGTRCQQCGEPCDEYSLRECGICRTLFCPRCAVVGYGREFCSDRCRAFFFFGEEEELGPEQ